MQESLLLGLPHTWVQVVKPCLMITSLGDLGTASYKYSCTSTMFTLTLNVATIKNCVSSSVACTSKRASFLGVHMAYVRAL